MNNFCSARGFEDLMGFVDFKIEAVDSDIQKTPIKQALTACSLELAQFGEIKEHKNLLESFRSGYLEAFQASSLVLRLKIDLVAQNLLENQVDRKLIGVLQMAIDRSEECSDDLFSIAESEPGLKNQYTELSDEAT